MKKIILWMLIFTGFIYALMGLHNSSEQEIIKKETKIQNTIDSLQNVIDSLQLQKNIIQIKDDIELEMDCGDTIVVKATMYNAVLAQCDDTPDKTADQSKIPNVDSCSHLNWIAVSQDLLWFNDGPIRYGDTVYVVAGHKTGYYIVRDAMNKRWTNRIDFLESTGVEAYKYNKAELIINS